MEFNKDKTIKIKKKKKAFNQDLSQSLLSLGIN